MSSRQLRRLQGQSSDFLVDPKDFLDQEEEEEEEEEEYASSSVLNAFALLNDDDDDDESDQSDQEDPEPEPEPEPIITKKKKKKKKKKKGKSKIQEPEPVDEEMEFLENEIAKKKEAMLARGEISSIANFEQDELVASLFSCQSGDFNVQNEFKAIFGMTAAQAEIASGASTNSNTSSANSSQRRNQRFNGSGKKSFLFGIPENTWPEFHSIGLSMELVETEANTKFFRFVFSEEYQTIQDEYRRCVASNRPQTLANLLQYYPYHVDTLLQLAEYYKSTNDLASSGDLIRRALYAYECAFHSEFDLTLGTCRLSTEFEENRSFMLALFRHLQMVSRRGCNKTALTCSKALLALCPDIDPMGVLHCIDFFALRCNHNEFIRVFASQFDNKRLYLLPNFAFSLAMAGFFLQREQEQSQQSQLQSSKKKKTTNGDNDQDEGPLGPQVDLESPWGVLTMEADCDAIAQQAIILFPMALGPLLEKVNVSGAEWQSLFDHDFFRYTKTSQMSWVSKSLQHLIKIFVERNHGLWMDPEVLSWLKKQVIAVLERVDNGDQTVQQLIDSRDELFSITADHNIFQHLMISDFSDTIATVPEEFLEGGQLPVPLQQLAQEEDEFVMPNPYYGDMNQLNPFLMFFGSMLPWTGIPNQGNVGDGDTVQITQEQQDLLDDLAAQFLTMWNGGQGHPHNQ